MSQHYEVNVFIVCRLVFLRNMGLTKSMLDTVNSFSKKNLNEMYCTCTD